MKKMWITILTLLFLGGCRQIITEDLSLVDRVHIILNRGADNLNQSLVVIDDPSSIQELVHILETAKIYRLVRDDEVILTPAVYYELYEGDELLQTLMFNGKDTLRIFKGGLCYEVKYQSLTLADWYEQVK